MGFPDPAAATGSEAEQLEVFRRVRDGLRQRIFAYLNHEEDSGSMDLRPEAFI
jgi:hypothetical protein